MSAKKFLSVVLQLAALPVVFSGSRRIFVPAQQ